MNKPTPPPPEFQQPEYSEKDTISFFDIMLILARQIKGIKGSEICHNLFVQP